MGHERQEPKRDRSRETEPDTDAEGLTVADGGGEAGRTRARARVLVVEDDIATRDAVAVALSDQYDVVEANDGVLALSLLESHRFDAVVLDLMMPGVNGQQVLRAAQARSLSVPFVLASASEDVEAVARRFGVADYMRKPFGLDDLEAAVSSAVLRGVWRDSDVS